MLLRNQSDRKYDYRYSQLVFVFARLVQQGWLQLDELAGFSDEKRSAIRSILDLD
ncbi:MAG: hypothetical protein U9Q81_08410 [Pseudomonadota bacterium]|nr:hypothetical protein [Pseudomonadota bacterium]